MNRALSPALLVPLAVSAVLSACSGGGGSDGTPSATSAPAATPPAACGPGSRPETDIQGRVPLADYESGRAAEGYTCNTTLVGAYGVPHETGTVGGFKVERYTDAAGHDCAYYDTTLLFPTNNIFNLEAGVNVLDMSDPAQPVLTARLLTPAMLSPHESVVVAERTGVLAAVTGNPAFYPGVVDVYDLEPDCRNPRLRASAPVGFLGHESGMAPDGRTFYSASPGTPTLTAVDISGPIPLPLLTMSYNVHGLSISDDGNRAYLAYAGDPASGLMILDVSEIQARVPNPQVREVGYVSWDVVTIPQNAIPFTRNGHPYVLEIDEYSAASQGGGVTAHGSVVGAGRIIDIADETQPRVISDLRLAVHQPENRDAIADDPGAQNPTQGYAGHYCNIPTRVNPDIVACSMIASGLRVFDIRDPQQPREVAYFIAPTSQKPFPVFDGGNWAMSSPSFVPERHEIWYSDGYTGFYVVRLTNGAWSSALPSRIR